MLLVHREEREVIRLLADQNSIHRSVRKPPSHCHAVGWICNRFEIMSFCFAFFARFAVNCIIPAQKS